MRNRIFKTFWRRMRYSDVDRSTLFKRMSLQYAVKVVELDYTAWHSVYRDRLLS
jgi:hypothetical protein